MIDSESLQLIHKDGGLTRLMEFVLTPNKPEIQTNAVKCIVRVAQSCKGTGDNYLILTFQRVKGIYIYRSNTYFVCL